ncbi:NAD(P)-dependent oxidoreductase [Pseudoroseomonas cervicalis]|uniref:NAD(P)-dependent oxidoreductase n=1 Tax=Teichococcus cervicalis TaxID=204525 RepID=UPI002788B3A9|nr:NAD(P)-dependent oxidoreductase [Pseudoroseomonas cervicalis]MDQ1081847.1 3-hydroxyisobutyrate dehydrogenase-like beta-hydroxyacid dehydrogenase [Pseudoroseomonas cervicalis]
MSGQVLGFVGLGQMGSRMAARLIKAGHWLVVCDTSEAALAPLLARGAQRAATPREVADRADWVLGSLPNPDAVRAVGLGPEGLLQGQRARRFIDLSTTGPRVARLLAEAFAGKGRVVIDAPVSGGITGAERGTLAIMVSGPREAFEEVAPILGLLGKAFFCGEQPGQAQVMKLCNNLLAAAALAVSSEAIVMGVKAGLDPSLMCEVINASSGRNSATQDKFPRAIIPRSFDFGFATGLSHKDVRLCVDEAEAMGVPMVVGSAVRQMLAVTSASFGPESDFTNIARVVEGWAGVEIGRAG